jgi:hypothetical protein
MRSGRWTQVVVATLRSWCSQASLNRRMIVETIRTDRDRDH